MYESVCGLWYNHMIMENVMGGIPVICYCANVIGLNFFLIYFAHKSALSGVWWRLLISAPVAAAGEAHEPGLKADC